MSSLSRDWTAKRFYQVATTELEVETNSSIYVQRFDRMNKSIGTIANLFYDLMASAYMTPVTLVPDTLGRYSSAGTGTWTTATLTVTFAGMNTPFASGDVGKLIVFTIGAAVYTALISTYVSASAVTVIGSNLPTIDGTINIVVVASTVPTGRSLSLLGLRIMRTGQQVKMELESTSTQSLEAVTSQSVFNFDATAQSNQNKIVWCVSGEEILIAYGNGLPSAGTFTLRYPRIPNLLVLDTDNPDLPDGAAIQIALLHFRTDLARIMEKENFVKDYAGEYAALITTLYRTFGQTASAEEIKEKVIALK
jgi:hypothetical protein